MKKRNQNERTARGGTKAKRSARGMSLLFGSVWAKRIISALLCFAFAFTVAGCAAFAGTFPFGIAAVAASSGTFAVLATLAGALLGSARIHAVGGAYAMIITALTVGRMAASVYLSSDKLPDELQDKKKRASILKQFCRRILKSPREAIGEAARAGGNIGGIMLRENIKIRLALSGAAALFAGAWSVVEGGYAYYDLFGAVLSLLTTPMITYLFYAAAERNMRNTPWRECAVLLSLAAVTMSLHGISAEGTLGGAVFDLGALFAFSVSAVISLGFGVHRGAVCGLLCGITVNPLYAPSYALGALVCGIIGRSTKTLGVIAGGAMASVWAVYVGGLEGMTAVFPPSVVACAVLVPLVRHDMIKLPPSLFGDVLPGRTNVCSVAEMSLLDMRRRISRLSDGMLAVSGVLESLSEKLSKPERAEFAEIVCDTFEIYCSTCRMRDRCHAGRSPKTAAVMRAMTDELSRGGTATAASVPSSVAASCYSMGRILDEINLRAGRKIAELRQNDKLSVIGSDFSLAGELIAHAGEAGEEVAELDGELSKKLARALTDNNFHASAVAAYGGRTKHIFAHDIDLAAARLGGDDIQKLIEDTCGQRMSPPEFELDGAVLSMRIHSVPSYKCESGTDSAAASSVHMYCSVKRGCDADCSGVTLGAADGAHHGEVSGDTITSFEADGKFYMIISDGMGSGREAALTSGVCAGLLCQLISSGAELDTAIKMLNGIIRSGGRECSTTVDIAEIDLYSGRARFIKSGAAPSFVLRDGGIFRLQSKTVPIGIMRALDAEMIKFDVQRGDRVVMVSDGISRSYDECPWLLDMMSSDETVTLGDPSSAARRIVAEAAARGAVDDITAGVIAVGSL